MELAYFSLKRGRRETTKRVAEEIKQHFVQDKGEKNISLLYQFKQPFPLANKSMSCQLQFQYIWVFLIGTLLPAGNVIRKTWAEATSSQYIKHVKGKNLHWGEQKWKWSFDNRTESNASCHFCTAFLLSVITFNWDIISDQQYSIILITFRKCNQIFQAYSEVMYNLKQIQSKTHGTFLKEIK